MKKIILSAAFLAFAGISAVKANDFKIPAGVVVAAQDSTTKTPVKLEELPEAVKTTLKDAKYKDWTPTAAFMVTAGDKSWYQIDLKNGDQTASLNVGKDGVVMQ